MRLMQVLDSDIIDAIGFDHTANLKSGAIGTLGVAFKANPSSLYTYADVPADDFIALCSAESIGKLFHEKFRKTKYPFQKSARPPTLKK